MDKNVYIAIYETKVRSRDIRVGREKGCPQGWLNVHNENKQLLLLTQPSVSMIMEIPLEAPFVTFRV